MAKFFSKITSLRTRVGYYGGDRDPLPRWGPMRENESLLEKENFPFYTLGLAIAPCHPLNFLKMPPKSCFLRLF